MEHQILKWLSKQNPCAVADCGDGLKTGVVDGAPGAMNCVVVGGGEDQSLFGVGESGGGGEGGDMFGMLEGGSDHLLPLWWLVNWVGVVMKMMAAEVVRMRMKRDGEVIRPPGQSHAIH